MMHTEMNQYLLEEGEMILLNSNVVHSTNSPIKNHILVIQLPLKFMQKVSGNQYNHHYVFKLNSSLSPILPSIQQCMKKMIENAQFEITEGRLAPKMAVYQFLLLLLKEYKEVLDVQNRLKSLENQRQLIDIVNYVKDHYQTDISLSQVASQGGSIVHSGFIC